ncbi:MAG: ABC transporter ATP-binding protein [Actinomycetota bacterium]|nr:ABC transporter ATP-binding protein [Actinomycetota bacterium]
MNPGPYEQSTRAPRLEIDGLTVSYRVTPVVRDVSFTAEPGRVTGVVGPNGAGKSTILKSVLGLVAPDAGRVLLGGRPLAEDRLSVAYLPQRADVDWSYPAQVRDVVAMGRYPHVGLLRRLGRDDRRAIDDALERVGMAAFARRQIGELSGGQQQRVFVARALAQGADVLLLDEPFAAVDAPTVRMLVGLLRQLAGEGRTVVAVLHELDTIRLLCDHVVLLNRTVVTQGAPADVMDRISLAFGADPGADDPGPAGPAPDRADGRAGVVR